MVEISKKTVKLIFLVLLIGLILFGFFSYLSELNGCFLFQKAEPIFEPMVQGRSFPLPIIGYSCEWQPSMILSCIIGILIAFYLTSKKAKQK